MKILIVVLSFLITLNKVKNHNLTDDSNLTTTDLSVLDDDESEENETLLNYDETSHTDSIDKELFYHPQNPDEFMDYYEELMLMTKERLEQIFEQYMPQLLRMGSSVTLSTDCTYDTIKILLGLRQLKPWAIKSK